MYSGFAVSPELFCTYRDVDPEIPYTFACLGPTGFFLISIFFSSKPFAI